MRRRNWLAPAILLVLGFAWGNSILSGDASKGVSGEMRGLLAAIFPFLEELPEYALRKIAHFAEFAVLGFLLAWDTVQRGKTGFARFSAPVSLAMLAALIDETIQLYRPGRLSSVVDVWIDTAGVFAGICLLYVLRAAILYLKEKRK